MNDPKDILNKIIANEGDCSWTTPEICARCPMSQLKKHPNGSYVGCLEAIGATELTGQKANEKYLDKATELLIEHEIDDLLKKD